MFISHFNFNFCIFIYFLKYFFSLSNFKFQTRLKCLLDPLTLLVINPTINKSTAF